MRFSKQIKVNFPGMLVFLVRLCRELSFDFYDLFYIGKRLFFQVDLPCDSPILRFLFQGISCRWSESNVPIRVDFFR